MFQGRTRCSLNCFGSCALKLKGTRIKYLSSLYVCLSKEILREANWTSKKPFSCWRKCQTETTQAYTARYRLCVCVCIRAFHPMKAGLRFVDICNNALRIQKPPPAPLPPNVLSYCWFQARSVCPQPRNDQQWVFLILSHRICVYLWHAAHRPELEECCWPPNQGGLISCRQTVSSGAADGCWSGREVAQCRLPGL